eukprot:TRINITY_DN2599_c0_g1_i2.p3 TRINITY_DN2599_c0_g1~~TRINITY_DN2599_c0_g1_i2.p3  ORF type:complete len:292 (+),score=133.93 TRINITY_DN2599_c0_g1_i2:1393-2268(+)
MQFDLQELKKREQTLIEHYDRKTQQVHQKYRKTLQEEQEQHEREKEILRINTERRLIEEQREHRFHAEKELLVPPAAEGSSASLSPSTASSVATPKEVFLDGEEEFKKLKEQYEGKIRELELLIERRDSEYERLQGIRQKLETKCSQLLQQLEEEQKQAKLAVANTEKEKEVELTNQHQKELEALEKHYQTQLALQKEDATKEKDNIMRAYHELEAKQAKLLSRFAVEAQREDDAAKIARLEKELAGKDADMKKVKEEAMVFKLELLNREQNYNKTFASSPKGVGSQAQFR